MKRNKLENIVYQKIKLSILFLIFFCFLQYEGVYSQQQWAPIGAKWYYDAIRNCGGSGEDCGYISIESITDTIVKNKIARLLKIEHFEVGLPYSVEYEIMYGDSDRVYHFKHDTFYVLYDFSVQAGDTVVVWDTSYGKYWDIAWGIDTVYCFKYVVDSTGTKNIDGQTLRVIYPSYDVLFCGWEMDGDIIEKIGEKGMMFGKPNVIPLNYSTGIRCYQDSFLYYKPYSRDCDYITSLQDYHTEQVKIYPTLTADYINIQIEQSANSFIIELKDILGRTLKNDRFPYKDVFSLDVSSMPQGVYILVIRYDEALTTRLIIKL